MLSCLQMSDPARMIELPEDLQAFAEELVRSGKSASVADVVREALEARKLASLREAIDEGIAELDAGGGLESTPEEIVAEAAREAGLTE
jgi:Arc/MetJ-type ribon-helix-helix transcriptional regulator